MSKTKLAGACAAVFVLAGLAATPARATTETIDLASAPLGTFTNLTLGDYVLSWIGYGDYETVGNVGGINVLQDGGPGNASGAEITISRVDHALFSVESVDIAAPNGDSGYRVDLGGSSYGTGSSSGISIPSTFTTVHPSGAVKVSSFDVNIVDGGSGYAVANIVVSTPEPASMALLGAGILGMALVRRRQRA